MHKLKYDPAVEAVYNGLPQHVRERVSVALAAACEDPQGATDQYGEEDGGVVRVLLADDAMAVLLVGHTTRTLTVLQITYLG